MANTNHMKSVWQGQAWHGASITEILKGIAAQQAGMRPSPNVHTIAELVHHMTAWRDFTINMLNGNFEYKVVVNGEIDWPVIESCSEDDWKGLKERLQRSQETLESLIGSATDDQLDQPAGNRPFPVRVVVEGVTDHDMYHGGQIMLIKKLVATFPPPNTPT